MNASALVLLRETLERYANGCTDPAPAIRALTEVDGRNPFVARQRELWRQQGVYGGADVLASPPDRPPRDDSDSPIDGEQERVLRRDFSRRLAACFHEMWTALGANVNVNVILADGTPVSTAREWKRVFDQEAAR